MLMCWTALLWQSKVPMCQGSLLQGSKVLMWLPTILLKEVMVSLAICISLDKQE